MSTIRTVCFLAALVALQAGARASEPMPRVTMETSAGSLVIELDAKLAPASVENFLSYVDQGFYDGSIFHRVIPGFMLQGGGYDTDFKLKERQPPVVNESRNGLSNLRGTIAMARTSDPDSANSQFFINLADNRRLDGNEYRWGYTVFGRVVEGMEVADEIAGIPTGPAGPFRKDAPQSTVIIKRVSRTNAAEPAAE